MAVSESTLAVRLPQELAAELEQLARETGRSKSYYARQAIIEFLEDRADYLRAVAILERERGRPNFTLEEVKRELGLDD
jgi:RHH-type transcriptional regulator, rel operon repressor / antitoxin RelB